MDVFGTRSPFAHRRTVVEPCFHDGPDASTVRTDLTCRRRLHHHPLCQYKYRQWYRPNAYTQIRTPMLDFSRLALSRYSTFPSPNEGRNDRPAAGVLLRPGRCDPTTGRGTDRARRKEREGNRWTGRPAAGCVGCVMGCRVCGSCNHASQV